jgi:hypothetical protein
VTRSIRTGRSHALLVVLLVGLLVACGTPGTPTPVAEGPTAVVAAGNPEASAAATEAPTVAPPAQATTAAPTIAPTVPVVAGSRTAAAPPTAPKPPTVAPTVRPVTTSALATHRLVTFYGHPFDDRMGVLGEYDPPVVIQKLKEQTAAYTAADPTRPGLCTIELIASVAQGSPGADGLYIARTPTAEIEKWAQLTQQQGCLLMLDIQMGYDTVDNDIKAILPFLQRPHVHLAIDPEFHVKRGQIPGESFGSATSGEIAGAMRTLQGLVKQYNLPDKILVLHQFREDMLPDKENIKPLANIDLVVMMDGWGLPQAKIANYGAFVRDEPIQYGGIKLFYKQDDPLMTPAEVIHLDPTPLVIIYQ